MLNASHSRKTANLIRDRTSRTAIEKKSKCDIFFVKNKGLPKHFSSLCFSTQQARIEINYYETTNWFTYCPKHLQALPKQFPLGRTRVLIRGLDFALQSDNRDQSSPLIELSPPSLESQSCPPISCFTSAVTSGRLSSRKTRATQLIRVQKVHPNQKSLHRK